MSKSLLPPLDIMELIIKAIPDTTKALAAIGLLAQDHKFKNFSAIFLKKLLKNISINHTDKLSSAISTQFKTISSFIEVINQKPSIIPYIQHIVLCIPLHDISISEFQQFQITTSQLLNLSSVAIQLGCCTEDNDSEEIDDSIGEVIFSQAFLQTIKNILDQPQISQIQIGIPTQTQRPYPYISFVQHLLCQKSYKALSSLNVIDISGYRIPPLFKYWRKWTETTSLNIKHVSLDSTIINQVSMP